MMEIEESHDNNDMSNVQDLTESISHTDEARYLIEKLLAMTLSKGSTIAQVNARLKKNEAMLAEVRCTCSINIFM